MSLRDYLLIDRYLRSELDAQALALALRNGLLDRAARGPVPEAEVPVRSSAGRRVLIDLLAANEVIELQNDSLVLTPGFRAVLPFRDLIEAKIAFAGHVARDVGALLPLLLDDLPRFMERSATFGLFRYDRCFEATPENIAATRTWMRYTTALTRYEGAVLASQLDLGSVERLLDVGGNSGELALQFCAAAPGLAATVFDLPVVCAIGREHVRARGDAGRIGFVAGDVRRDRLPDGADLVMLKSLLHDWPEREAAAILAKACVALRPGGRLVIFERGPLRAAGGLTFAQLPNLVFLHFFRAADFYLQTLRDLGLEVIRAERVRLEMDFHLIEARRRGVVA
jgi:SAM-dependent methyltransferase